MNRFEGFPPPEWAYCVFAAMLALWVGAVAGVLATSAVHSHRPVTIIKIWHEESK